MCYFFFFSSRRRHTRFDCDWSSDVCSSDLQLGIDSHRTDPLTHLDLDVQGFARAVARLVELSPQLVALGGGGYDLANVARAWTAAWAVMNGIELAAELPASFAEDARRYRFRGPTLWDPPEPPAGAKRLRAEAYVQRQVEAARRRLVPLPPPQRPARPNP